MAVWLGVWALASGAAWAAPTCAADTAGFPADPRLAAHGVVVVAKGARTVALYDGGTLRGCWRVGLGAGGDDGPKLREGDQRTPEGWYRVSDRPSSKFYHALMLHYPSTADADRALAAAVIDAPTRDAIARAERTGEVPPQTTPLGSWLLLHGGGGDTDWTLGCIGLADADIDALRAGLPADHHAWVLITP